jgi:hypothetical protein
LLIVASIAVWPIGLIGIAVIERKRIWQGNAVMGCAVGAPVAVGLLFVLSGIRWNWG